MVQWRYCLLAISVMLTGIAAEKVDSDAVQREADVLLKKIDLRRPRMLVDEYKISYLRLMLIRPLVRGRQSERLQSLLEECRQKEDRVELLGEMMVQQWRCGQIAHSLQSYQMAYHYDFPSLLPNADKLIEQARKGDGAGAVARLQKRYEDLHFFQEQRLTLGKIAYVQAESGDSQGALETCRLLLKEFHPSKRSVWAILMTLRTVREKQPAEVASLLQTLIRCAREAPPDPPNERDKDRASPAEMLAWIAAFQAESGDFAAARETCRLAHLESLPTGQSVVIVFATARMMAAKEPAAAAGLMRTLATRVHDAKNKLLAGEAERLLQLIAPLQAKLGDYAGALETCRVMARDQILGPETIYTILDIAQLAIGRDIPVAAAAHELAFEALDRMRNDTKALGTLREEKWDILWASTERSLQLQTAWEAAPSTPPPKPHDSPLELAPQATDRIFWFQAPSREISDDFIVYECYRFPAEEQLQEVAYLASLGKIDEAVKKYKTVPWMGGISSHWLPSDENLDSVFEACRAVTMYGSSAAAQEMLRPDPDSRPSIVGLMGIVDGLYSKLDFEDD